MAQFPPSSPYRVIISEFIIALSSLCGRAFVQRALPEMVLKYCEIGYFTPSMPMRDQSRFLLTA